MKASQRLKHYQLPLVLLHTAGLKLALEARWVVGCSRLAAKNQPLNTSGDLYQLKALLGYGKPAPDEEERLMTLRSQTGAAWQLHFTGSIELIEATAASLHPLPPLLASRRLWQAAKALFFYQDQCNLLLDADQLKAQLDAAS